MKITIKSKFSCGLLIIFTVAFILLNYFTSSKIEKSNENIITQELITIKKNCNVFIRQAFMINDYNNEEFYFKKLSHDITEELGNVIKSDIGIYSLDGKLVYSSNNEKFINSKFEDITNAINNKTSYTINYKNNIAEVYFSYPVVIGKNTIGILRIIKDYSLLYNQGNNILNSVLSVTLIIFAVAFLFSYLLSTNITVPLLKLTKASTKAANGNFDIKIDIDRKDELGELSSNFSFMIDKVNEQINTIKEDRDNLKKLINHKKHFYDNVTHELKTPLTSILGYAQMIKQNEFSDKEFFDKGTNHIINESKRLHNMVINLLELSKQTDNIKINFTKIELGKLLKDICDSMIFKAERYGNNIICNTSKNIYIYGNENNLKEVFINIIDNAIKYGLSNSTIRVNSCLDGKYVYVNIINKGYGISKENINKIFTPFYRIDKQKSRELGSCGLGLSISKAIIEQHKGSIKIESIPNNKTCVSIKLPLYKLNI